MNTYPSILHWTKIALAIFDVVMGLSYKGPSTLFVLSHLKTGGQTTPKMGRRYAGQISEPWRESTEYHAQRVFFAPAPILAFVCLLTGSLVA